ncbi:hypothetical protein BC828DRAFT_377701 [Blastocladiella britannica]|nr:hypothetical protein BC828DRAFT_377701 [Blastocladiella britannica]
MLTVPATAPALLGLPSILRGPRIALVEQGPVSDDAALIDAIYAMKSDPVVMQHLVAGGVSLQASRAESAADLAARAVANASGQAANYTLHMISNNGPSSTNPSEWPVVGVAGFPRWIARETLRAGADPDDVVRLETGIILDTAAQGRGIAHEALTVLLDAAFTVARDAHGRPIDEAWFRTLDGNVAMRGWCAAYTGDDSIGRVWEASTECGLSGVWVEYRVTHAAWTGTYSAKAWEKIHRGAAAAAARRP